MVSFDATIVIQLINFLFFLFILNKVEVNLNIKLDMSKKRGPKRSKGFSAEDQEDLDFYNDNKVEVIIHCEKTLHDRESEHLQL